MVEGRGNPRARVVAALALLRDSRLPVVGIRGAVVILGMAAVAIRGRVGELAVDVTQIAGHAHVRARQREHGLAVIERRGNPCRRCVAGLALLRNACLNVGWVRRGVEILGMAAVAIRRRALESSADVARGALERRVRAGESEPGELEMVELGVEPGVRAVARFAGRGEVERLVVRIHGFLEIRVVARKAGGLKTGELANGLSLVAIGAFQHRVRAEKRKPIRVLPHPVGANVPALHRVTPLAIRAELAAVNIGVAIRAARAHIREYEIRVAERALNFLMHAAQRVARVVVIELGDASDRFPAGARVAVLARNADGAVRIPADLRSL